MGLVIEWGYIWFFGGCFFGVGMTILVCYLGYQAAKRRGQA